VEPKAGVDDVEKKFLTLPGLELRLLDRAANITNTQKKYTYNNSRFILELQTNEQLSDRAVP
jgi:hypothetical protein